MSDDSVTIGIQAVTSGFKEAQKEVEDLKGSVASTGDASGKAEGSWKEHISRVKEAGEEYQVASSPIRSISWDLLLTGRSLSMMNQGLFGSNQQFKQFISLIYSAASVLRLVVMAFDAQRLAAERAAAAGYMSTHFIPPTDPYAIGARLSPKQMKEKYAQEFSQIGLNMAWAKPEPVFGARVSRQPDQYQPMFDLKAGRDFFEHFRTPAKDTGEAKNVSKFASKQPFVEAGIESTSQSYLPQRAAEDQGKGINFGGVAGGAIGLGLSAIPAIGPIMGPIIGALLGAGASQGLSQMAQGGVIQKDMPVYAHKGEALVREKDFYAVNQILSSFNKPMRTDVSQNKQPSVALPKASQTYNSGGNDARSFTNINVTTGPISSNIDVNNLFKKMAQAQIQESRRRTGQ
jgi:hypothetical protein